LQASGLRSDQISQVRGYADQKLRVPGNPLEPSNRRISLIVQYIVKDDDEAPVSTSDAKPEAKAESSPDAKPDAKVEGNHESQH
jgi:chemotaxis protein MotB